MRKRVYLSPSNQGNNTYIIGDTTEKAVCEEIAGYVREALERQGIEAYGWKATLAQRIAESNQIGVNVHMAIHTNASGSKAGKAGTAQGVTVFTERAGLKSVAASGAIYRELQKIYPWPEKSRGVLDGSFAEVLQPRAATPYLELAFHDNPDDARWILDHKREIGEAVCKGLCAFFEMSYITPMDKPEEPTQGDTEGLTPIMGQAVATAEQMWTYLKAVNSDAPDYAAIYLEEGAAEGVRGDIAFAQSCIETGNWRFGGDVKPEQNNFAGIGATGGVPGNSFSLPRIGIRAQIQHLKCYASTLPLACQCVDPRWGQWLRGKAPYVEWLGSQENPNGIGWAAGAGYGQKILAILDKILQMPDKPAGRTVDWGEAGDILKAAGVTEIKL